MLELNSDAFGKLVFYYGIFCAFIARRAEAEMSILYSADRMFCPIYTIYIDNFIFERFKYALPWNIHWQSYLKTIGNESQYSNRSFKRKCVPSSRPIEAYADGSCDSSNKDYSSATTPSPCTVFSWFHRITSEKGVCYSLILKFSSTMKICVFVIPVYSIFMKIFILYVD